MIDGLASHLNDLIVFDYRIKNINKFNKIVVLTVEAAVFLMGIGTKSQCNDFECKKLNNFHFYADTRRKFEKKSDFKFH